MGRPKATATTAKPAAKKSSAPKKPAKSTLPPSRSTARTTARQSYAEDIDSSEPEEVAPDSDFSASDAAGGSSGSEYGKKKGSPKKLSPAKKGPAGRKRGAPSKNGKKVGKTVAPPKKSRRAADSDDDDDDEELSISETESNSDASSGSEYGKAKKKKKLKREAPARSQPKRGSAGAGKKRASKNGRKTVQEEVEEEEEEEVEEPAAGEVVASAEEDADSESPAPAPAPPKGPAAAGKTLANKTDTDLTTITFTTDKKTAGGGEANYKIVSFNVGGIKSWVAKKGLDYLRAESPQILCLQEIKCSEKTRPEEVSSLEDYPHIYWSYGQGGQSGVATFCQTKPESVTYGFPIEDAEDDEDKMLMEGFNKEGRLITIELDGFYLVNTYVPNSGRGIKDEAHPKPYPPRVSNGERLAWDRLLRNYVKELEGKKPVVVTGDLNVAHQAIDLTHPGKNLATAGYTPEERASFTTFLEETKFIDAYRHLYPDQKEVYTFWSYMGGSREKNVGWRLDYYLLSEGLKEKLIDVEVRKEVYGSDHCPLVLWLAL